MAQATLPGLLSVLRPVVVPTRSCRRHPPHPALPAVLASLDRPFVIERPDELRGLVIALAERLAASARGD